MLLASKCNGMQHISRRVEAMARNLKPIESVFRVWATQAGGLSQAELARQLGVNRSSIHYTLKRVKLKQERKRRQYHRTEDDELTGGD